jgi:hypothetical protein
METTFLIKDWLLILLIVTLINFLGAILLKDALKMTFRQNKSFKYIFIIPPFAILAWMVSWVYLIITKLLEITIGYFKD